MRQPGATEVRVGLAVAVLLIGTASCGGGEVPSTTPATTEPPVSVTYDMVITAHAGPTCPVERPDEPCPDVPVRGRVAVSSAGELVVSGELDAAGNYRISLPPGTYVVGVDTGAVLPRCEPVSVSVVDRNVDVDVACDSGIR